MPHTQDLCRHGRPAGDDRRAAELGAFVDPAEPSTTAAEPVREGPLAGIRIAVKDNIDVAGQPTRAGSEAIPVMPAERDATVVARLRRAGAVIGERTRMDEFAMTTEGPRMRNPADASRSVGGSSGGSALAVAAGAFCLALGTDTGGSVRIPASYCGVVGFKPGYERISTDGVVPMSHSLDHVGILGCSVAAVRELFTAITDPPKTSGASRPSSSIGVPSADFLAAATPRVRRVFDAAIAALRMADFDVVEIRMPDIPTVLDIHYTVALVEAHRYHRGRFESFDAHGTSARGVLRRAATYSERDYAGAQRRRARLRSEVSEAMAAVDAVVLPTTPSWAPARAIREIHLGDRVVDPVTAAIWYTAIFDDVGIPALSLPIPHNGPLPIGLQLAGHFHRDEALLDLASRVEGAIAGLEQKGLPKGRSR